MRRSGCWHKAKPAIPRLGNQSVYHFTEGLQGLGWVRGGGVHGHPPSRNRWPGGNLGPEILRQVGAVEGLKPGLFQEVRWGAWVSPYGRQRGPGQGPALGPHEESFGEETVPRRENVGWHDQGNAGRQPRYLLSASTMKHFLANSNEDGRPLLLDFDQRTCANTTWFRSDGHRGGECAIVHGVLQRGQQDPRHGGLVHPRHRREGWNSMGWCARMPVRFPTSRAVHYYEDATAAVAGCVKAALPCFWIKYSTPR